MKSTLQLVISAAALGSLLVAAASHATNLAELPLKASVLAKPNVIFGLDDSGSMDGEVMMYNNDGAFWWDYTNASGWGVDAAHPNSSLRTITSTWFNNVGDPTNQWRKMVYLFPNGTGTGDRQYNDAGNDHFAILPTTQFATLRWSGVHLSGSTYQSAPTNPALSPMHNPIYYNPLVTYAPWAPAQLSTGAFTPAQASITAAKSHPVRGTSVVNLTADVAVTTTADYVFTALPGMTIPAGAQKRVCDASNGSCLAWTPVATQEPAATTGVTRVAMAYYPATYWVKETCTVPGTPNVATDSCAAIPGGGTLKRYEIKSGNTFPSGRSYAAEMQNFANWYQYYRKRRLMLAGAMGETMENLTGMRLGVMPFDNRANVTMYDADATAVTDNRMRVAGLFYEVANGGGTPTRAVLKAIGDQFKRTDTTTVAGVTRYNVIQYACQRNNAFIVTDGFANNDTVGPPSWDSGKTAATWGTGAPYAASFSRDGILADLALRYYTNNPRPGLAVGQLQTTPGDTNIDLHMNTYGLTLGARGTLFLSESSPAPTNTTDWPNPNTNRNPTSVDDLWRATLSGRGKMYLATTPEETALRVQAGLADMQSLPGAQGGVAVSAINLSRNDGKAYVGMYNQRGWSGDLEARPINAATAAISTTPQWSAAANLAARAWSGRIIFSSNASAGVEFNAANVGAQVWASGSTAAQQQVVDYLRGDRSAEGTDLRTRTSLIGAIVNSEPVLARDEGMVYVASGEGMLHAVDTITGDEHWAYVPPDQLPAMGASAQRGWAYRTLLDATPVYRRLGSGNKLLVAGMGAAGRSYYGLDVSSPRNLTAAQAAAQYRWVFPAASDTANRALMGYTVGKPVITKTVADGDVVLVTSGYDNGVTIGDGKGRVWMLNAATGAVIKTFRTSVGAAGAEAGLAHLAAFKEPDGTVRYAYGGDLLGNVWRFDLATAGPGEHVGHIVATLLDSSNNPQPVTSTPELANIGGRRVVLVGTGRLLDIGDFGRANTQSFYAIADGVTLTNARSGLVQRAYTRGANPELSGVTVDWTNHRGWFFDLPAGEEINTDPTIAYGAVLFVANKAGASDCSQQSWMYMADFGTGAAMATTSTGAGALSAGAVSKLLSNTATASRLVVVLDSGGGLHGLSQGSNRLIFDTPVPDAAVINPTKNAWKEIRR